MASKTFAINTEPHTAEIGETRLFFQPEVIGAEFAEAYEALRDVQRDIQKATGGTKASGTKHAKEASDVTPAQLVELSSALRNFITEFLTPESRPVFESLRLPDRVLFQLMEWVAELYGGGSGNQGADGGQSSD
jgi:hypothetical protein